MAKPTSQDVTQLLRAMGDGDGDGQVARRLLPLVYDELRHVADRYMRRQPGNHTLQATALVNEAYMRLVEQDDATWANRAHFMGVAAKAMRTILIDHARRKHAAKRGGGAAVIALDEGAVLDDKSPVDLLAIDDALTRFAESYPDKAKVVELRFFGGLNVEESARVLDSSTATIKRDWRMAKAWLKRELSETDGDDERSD